MLRLRTFTLLAAGLLSLSATRTAVAQDGPGITIHFSGSLTDLDNRPVNGLVDLQVRILDQPIGGSELTF